MKLLPLSLLITLPLWMGTPPNAIRVSHYAVASDHPLASDAGSTVLSQGGNAADAAVATALALGVVSPASSGLGGGGFALVYRASDRSLHFLDFRETAPAATTPTMFAANGTTPAPSSITGGLAVAVPGEPMGLDTLLRRFGGRVPRARVAAPAIRLATRGFGASRFVSQYSRFTHAELASDPIYSVFLSPASLIPQGHPMRNPALGRTLRSFASSGAQPFYRGAIARQIVREVTAHGGNMTLADLRNYRVVSRAPLEESHYGHRWVTAPLPSAGGYTMMTSLSLMERWVPTPQSVSETDFFHALSQSWLPGYADRQRYFGDPDFASIPLPALTADPRRASLAAVFDPTRARPIADFDQPLAPMGTGAVSPDDHGTSHLCVIDRQGNIVSLTTTVNMPFGARFTAAGMIMNDQMDDFARQVGALNGFGVPGGSANLPGPLHRPISTMSPTIVFHGVDPVLCIGASGGSRIVTATETAALRFLMRQESLETAIERPRVHHQGNPAPLYIERNLDQLIRADLVARGYQIEEVDVNAIVQGIARRDGSTWAVSDPRKDGQPRGR